MSKTGAIDDLHRAIVDVSGDERKSGPIYNYAKVFTWWQFATLIGNAIETATGNVDAGKGCQTILTPQPAQAPQPNQPNQQNGLATPPPQPIMVNWQSNLRPEENLHGNCQETARYCGLANLNISAYPEWSCVTHEVWKRIAWASFSALFVQWGTAGASILIAYKTPVEGIGCRSGSYLLYAVLGTVSWMFLLISMIFSHEVMLRYQRVHRRHPTTDFRVNTERANHYMRTIGHTALAAAAVITRGLGKTIAVANTLWLIVSSLLEMIGGYNNCWCQGVVLSWGADAWVVIFRTSDQLAQIIQVPLGGGFAMSILVCTIALVFFWLGCQNKSDE